MMRLGHFRPVHVKSLAARAVRTTLAVRLQLVASQLQIENTIRGLLKVYGLKIRAIHRNRFAARVAELLAMASLPGLAAAIEPMLRERENMRAEKRRLIAPSHPVAPERASTAASTLRRCSVSIPAERGKDVKSLRTGRYA